MLLTIPARRVPPLAVRPSRLRLPALALAAVGGVGGLVVFGPGLRPVGHPTVPPSWAGDIAAAVTDPVVAPLRETSASYTSPVAIEAARASVGHGPTSGRASARAVMPPRRPTSVAALPAVEPAAPAVEAKAPSPFSVANLREKLPTTTTLLKPFTTVGNTMSGLLKRF